MKTLRITSAMLAVMLLASGASSVFAAEEQGNQEGEKKSYWVRFKDGVSSVGGRVKGAATTAYDYTVKPYWSYDQEAKDAIFANLDATATKYEAKPTQVDGKEQQPSFVARSKSWMANKYVAARKGMYNHPYIATPVWYAGLAAATAGTGYGLYKLYQFIDAKVNPADLEQIKDIAAKFKEAQTEESAAAFNRAILKNKSVNKGLHELAEVDATALNHLLHALEEYRHDIHEAGRTKDASQVSNAYETLAKVVDGCVAKVKASKEAATPAQA